MKPWLWLLGLPLAAALVFAVLFVRPPRKPMKPSPAPVLGETARDASEARPRGDAATPAASAGESDSDDRYSLDQAIELPEFPPPASPPGVLPPPDPAAPDSAAEGTLL
jgi:hypothetical protein